MLRTQISLTKTQKSNLEKASSMEGVSSSEIVRKALDIYLSKVLKQKGEKLSKINSLAGAWKGGAWDKIDASRWQRSLRREAGF